MFHYFKYFSKLPWARLGYDLFVFHRFTHPPQQAQSSVSPKSSEKFEESTHSCKFYFLFRDDCFSSGNFLNLSSNLSSVWNYNEVKKVLPSAVYITLLRCNLL